MKKRNTTILVVALAVIVIVGVAITIFSISKRNVSYPLEQDTSFYDPAESSPQNESQPDINAPPNLDVAENDTVTPPEERISNNELNEQMRDAFHGAYPNTEIDENGNVYVKNDFGDVVYTGKLDASGKAVLYDSQDRAVGEANISGSSYSLSFYNGNYIEKR